MYKCTVEPIGVSGKKLAPREKWFCESCNPYIQQRAKAAAAHRRELELLAEERLKSKQSKQLWAVEQEKRRLANLAKRQSSAEKSEK